MNIDALELIDFRGFEKKTFYFNRHFNVLIGENGSGKTTVLEALAVAVSPFISAVQGVSNQRPIRKSDIHRANFEQSIEPKIYTAVSAKGYARCLKWAEWLKRYRTTRTGGKT